MDHLSEVRALSIDIELAEQLTSRRERAQAGIVLTTRLKQLKGQPGVDDLSRRLLEGLLSLEVDYPRRIETMYAGNDNHGRLGTDDVPIYAVVKHPEDPNLREVRFVSLSETEAQGWREP